MMDIKKLSDEELVIATIDNADLFEYLIARYEKKLLRFILRISNFSQEEAEEILQEIFIKTWRNLHDFDQDSRFSSWIFRITRNETISAFRKYSSHGYDKQEQVTEDQLENFASEEDIEDYLSKKLNAENVRKILKYLPQNYREVLVLKYLEEKSTSEISDILQKPENTISTLIRRAKKDFKQRAEKLHFFQ